MGNKYIFNNNISKTKDNTVTIVTVSETFNKLTSSVSPESLKQAFPPSAAAEGVKEPEQSFWEKTLSWRSCIVLLMHSVYVIHGTTLASVSMALVCMCGPIQTLSKNTSSNTTTVFNISGYSDLTSFEDGPLLQEEKYEFNWDSQTRGYLLSGMFFTNFLAPMLANVLRGYLGNKISLALVTMVLAIFNFLSPIAARAHVYLFLATRVLTGLVVNSQMPIVGDTMAWWIPVKEKLTSVSFVMAGWYVGGTLGPLISGYLCIIPLDRGWPLIFYFNGALAVPWTIAVLLLSSRKPEDHPFISDKEKAYIMKTRVGLSQEDTNTKVADRPPYRSIFSSVPVLAFVLAAAAIFWNITILLTCTSIYMASVLRLSLQEVGIIIGVIWAFRFPASLMWSAFGNWLFRFESMTTNRMRKICFGLGQTLACVFALGTSFCGEQQKWLASALILICVASATFGTNMMGLVPLDMAPRYSGFITSLSTSVAFLISFTGPIFVSALTTQGSFEEWQLVWITMGAVYFVCGLVFIIFGSASLQPWAVSNIETKTVQVDPPTDHISQPESVSLNHSAKT